MVKLKRDEKCISLSNYCTMFFETGFHEVHQKSRDFGSLYPDPETVAAKWNSAIINFISNTCVFFLW